MNHMAPLSASFPHRFADAQQPTMAIYWKALNELDVYMPDSVQTYRGADAETTLISLRKNQVVIEVME